MTPVFSLVADKPATTDARRRLREGFAHLAEHRLGTGSFVPTIDDAGGKPPLDPFTGKPRLYCETDRGFVLYSVGEDRKDDSGMGERPGPDKPGPDLVIEYPRRPVL